MHDDRATRRRLADKTLERYLELRARGVTADEAYNAAVDMAAPATPRTIRRLRRHAATTPTP